MFDHLFHDVTRMWSPLSLIGWDGLLQGMLADIYEVDNEMMPTADLPGMKKEDVEITFTEGHVTISG
jgi:HSP20 family molecular chaperone IbpA